MAEFDVDHHKEDGSMVKRNAKRKLVAASIVGGLLTGLCSVPSVDARAAETAEKTFSVQRILLRNLVGEVTIDRHKGSTTIVKFSGKKPMDHYVSVSKKGGRLEISGKSTVTSVTTKSGDKSGTVIIKDNTQVAIGPGTSSTVIIGNNVQKVGSGEPSWKLSILVPKGQALDLEGTIMRLSAGDLDAPVDARVDGAGDLTFGALKSSKFKMAGAGTATIESVTGDLSLELLGAADVTVEGGNIGKLYVKIEGAGDVRVGGKVHSAKLISVGSGDIQVDHVAEKPEISVTGAGDVNIGG